MKQTVKLIIILFLILFQPLSAQLRLDAKNERIGKVKTIQGPIDRAQNVININRLGQVVTNMGQFHPYTGVYPAGCWPLSSGHDQIYKMSFAVGVPYNVVNARSNKTKEWDPVAGYNNKTTGKIAISTDKSTWPLDQNGLPYWPIRTKSGLDSIVSQQDTYCLYRDNTNSQAQKLNIQVTQTSYAWSTSKDQDYIIWKLEILNDTDTPKDSLYFGLYYDFDAGGIEDEYSNDYYVWDSTKQLTYVVGPTGTTCWEPGSKPFLLGLAFLETPMVDNYGRVVLENGKQMGITDWHYSGVNTSAWGDSPDDDIVFFNWMSSAQSLRDDQSKPNLFHGPNRHIDDWRLQDTVKGLQRDGDGVDGIASSGPYHMEPHQKMSFIFAEVAQQDLIHLYQVAERVKQVYNNGFMLIPPPKPKVKFTALDNSVKLSWSNENEFSYVDPLTGRSAIKEYRIYKTIDPKRENWGDPVAILYRDTTKNVIIDDLYNWQDNSGVKNNFYYSYSVTVLDIDSIESGKAFLPANMQLNENTVEARPVISPKNSLNDIKVVPNPYIISAAWERKRLGDPKLGEPIREIAFTNLPEKCTIRIYTIDGNLVKTIEHDNAKGTEFWDLRSSSNQMIATGIYLYHISSDKGEKVSKFAVVR
ncbi:MAG: T9SS type A sorting domain-containing protein [Bacteroidota bacterium]|nr:T9SS type A sorting domain-containing protein [Bacteroidota bacterium]MDP4193521.1 T9SS type A sorting domain-containing protein [Bacteroidota bacterium]